MQEPSGFERLSSNELDSMKTPNKRTQNKLKEHLKAGYTRGDYLEGMDSIFVHFFNAPTQFYSFQSSLHTPQHPSLCS